MEEFCYQFTYFAIMSDIFISYAREDLERTRQLANVLGSLGWNVFIDRRIPAGKNWAEYIGKELDGAKCVIVIWSKASLGSRFVKLEANNALAKEKLIPVLIEDVSPPFEFGDLHAADLSRWNGDKNKEEFINLVTDIESLIGSRPKGEAVSDKSKVEEEKRLNEEAETRRKVEEEKRLKEEAEAKRKLEEEKRLKEEAEDRRKVEAKRKLKGHTETTRYKIPLIVSGIIAVIVIVILVVNSGKDDNKKAGFTEQLPEERTETSAEMQFWNDVLTNNNTVAGFKSYQKKYPNGSYFNQAQKKIDAIEDNQDWETALLSNTIAAYQEYERNHPTGRHLVEAKQKITDLEKQQQVASDEIARRNEDNAWNKAKTTNTISSYQVYQRAYPKGRYYSEAVKQIKAIKDATKLTIRQEYQGGIIFYIDASGQHGLIAAQSDLSTNTAWIAWANYHILIGATGQEIGSGRRNTENIVSKLGAGNYAAKLCADLVLNGFDDWFLPSLDELNELYLNKDKVGSFTGDIYWSSTEDNSGSAWLQLFNVGVQLNNFKSSTSDVRAVRAF